MSVTAAIVLGIFSLVEGDEAFVRTDYVRAAAIYNSTLGVTADSAEVLWRLARVYVCMGDLAEKNKKSEFYRSADDYARRCILADSTKSNGHTWRAAALGNIAMFEGGKEKIKLTYRIRDALASAIRLNPGDDIAYSILGSFYLALGNVTWVERQLAAVFLGRLPDGGYPEAEENLKKAIALAPEVIRNHCELGKVYLEMDRKHEALEQFRIVLTLPVWWGTDARTQRWCSEAIKTLQE